MFWNFFIYSLGGGNVKAVLTSVNGAFIPIGTNARMLRERKTFYFHFYEPFSFCFESWVDLKAPTLDVELFVQAIATQNTLVFL